MQHGPIGWRALVSALVVVATTLPVAARAEVRPCIGGGGPTCPTPVACTNDAFCFGMGSGRCVGPTGGQVCSADCSSLFTCSNTTDCPGFDPAIPFCQSASVSGGSGVCTYHDVDANPITTLCTSASSTASAAQVHACYSAGTNWSAGDCDGDMVPNGMDANPCDATNLGVRIPGPSPFCLQGHVCEGLTTVCAPMLRCAGDDDCARSAVRSGAAGPWQCLPVPGATTVHVCQPSCFATARCTVSAECGPFGACLASSTGGGSYCEPTAFMSCVAGCMTDTLDWSSPNGDCDHDGAQNLCDMHPCNGATGDLHCTANPSACSLADAGVFTLPDASAIIPDASVLVPDASLFGDASTNVPDGGIESPDASDVPDAFVEPTPDASVPVDMGATPMDGGSTGLDGSVRTTPGLGFGGGGGCRCATPGGARSSGGAVLVMLALGATLARRRRVTRR